MSETATPGLAWTEIAASAYRAYAASTGNKNYQGLPMPAFEDLPEAIQTAWEAAVRQVGHLEDNTRRRVPLETIREHMPESEASWEGWVRP